MTDCPETKVLLEKVGPEILADLGIGCFSNPNHLIWNGRLLSDHYVSKGRFKNILKKEIGKNP